MFQNGLCVLKMQPALWNLINLSGHHPNHWPPPHPPPNLSYRRTVPWALAPAGGYKEGEGGRSSAPVSAHSRSAFRICAECRSEHRTHSLETETGNIFCKESDVTYLSLCSLCCNGVCSVKGAQSLCEWLWLCS